MTFEDWAEDSQVPYRSVETRLDFWCYLRMAFEAGSESMRQENTLKENK